LNDPRLLYPPERGGHGLDAQWSDDFHHAAHAYSTGERRGYYEDFGSPAQLARALVQPFLYAGDYSVTRDRKHGAPPEGLSGKRFVVCLQNHDQVGNRARGDRLPSLLRDPAKQRLASSYLLLAPYLPLLFMGEEYGEDNPFPFFCSFGDPGLIKAVREGRKREFADLVGQEPMPDPHAETTFASARLSWSWPPGTLRAGLRFLHADLLAARRRWPALRQFEQRTVRLIPDTASGPLLELQRGEATIFFNLADHSCPLNCEVKSAYKVLFDSESPSYGGGRIAAASLREVAAFECIVLGPAAWPAFV
jgi:maltooligosyltrehalose trehalohydrolase